MKNTKEYKKLVEQLLIKVMVFIFITLCSTIFFVQATFSLEITFVAITVVVLTMFGLYWFAKNDIRKYDAELNEKLYEDSFFKSVVGGSHLPLIVTDIASISYYNFAAKKLFGQQSAFMETCGLMDLVADSHREILQLALTSEEDVDNLEIQISNDGDLDSVKYANFNISKEVFNGKLQYVIFAYDISVFYIENNKVKNESSIFRAALNNVPYALSIFDFNGKLFFLNERALNNPAFEDEEYFSSIIEYDINRNLLSTAFNIALSGDKYEDERVVRRKLSGEEYAKIQVAPIISDTHNVYVQYSLDDITKYRTRINELEVSANIFSGTFDYSNVGIVYWDGEGNFVSANRQYYKQLGYSEKFVDGSIKEHQRNYTVIEMILDANDLAKRTHYQLRQIPFAQRRFQERLINCEKFETAMKVILIIRDANGNDTGERREEWFKNNNYPIYSPTGQILALVSEFSEATNYYTLQANYEIFRSYLDAIANNFFVGALFIVSKANKIVFFGGEEYIKKKINIVSTTNLANLAIDVSLIPDINAFKDNIYSALSGNYSRISDSLFENRYDLQFFPIRNASGAIEYCMVIGYNITERVEFENQLTSQKNLLDSTFSDSQIPQIILDTSGNVIRANKKYCQLIGVADPVGDTIFGENSFLNKDIIIEKFEKALNGESGTYEISETKKMSFFDDDEDEDIDEFNFVLNFRCDPIINANSDIEFVVMNFIDISDTKMLINTMQRSSTINNIVTANFPNGVLILFDKDLKFILFEGKNEISSLNINMRIVGKHIDSVDIPFVNVLKPFVHKAFSSRQKDYTDFYLDISPDDNYPLIYYYDATLVPILANNNKDLEYVFVCVNNITARKELEATILEFNSKLEAEVANRTAQLKETTFDLEVYVKELQTTQDKLIKAQDELSTNLEKETALNEMKSRFISLMSHEFRTPLTIIQTSIYLLETYYEMRLTEKFDMSISKIFNAIDNMTKLLDNVLFLDEAKEQSANFFSLDISQLIRDIVSDILDSEKPRQPIVINMNAESIVMLTDEKLITQILTNLLSNSIKYTLNDSNIIVELNDLPDMVTLSVQDFGKGLSDDVVDRVFDTFVRSTDFTNVSGSGLGLAITKNCVDLLRGEITFETEKNVGTKFIVKLPKLTDAEIYGTDGNQAGEEIDPDDVLIFDPNDRPIYDPNANKKTEISDDDDDVLIG
ncbi:MAG: PAS domain-containing sensor histidine kinase [Ignavibacteria bacterium]|jgi:signal transduction histidine kinase/PAS domain-containing protein|nr:PAS domain-containing sensor histidine kinase [Ignavibacteria bacterium]